MTAVLLGTAVLAMRSPWPTPALQGQASSVISAGPAIVASLSADLSAEEDEALALLLCVGRLRCSEAQKADALEQLSSADEESRARLLEAAARVIRSSRLPW